MANRTRSGNIPTLMERATLIARKEGLSSLLSLGLQKTPLRRLMISAAASEMRKRASQIRGPQNALAFALSFKQMGISIKPLQVREEIAKLLDLLAARPPRNVLEIGTANGGTLFLFAQVAAEDSTVMSLDLPGGRFGGGYPEWKMSLYRAFAKSPKQRIRLLRENSHEQSTLEKVRGILGENELDFLFIDGDHTHEGVKRDFEMYSGLVRRGGLIGFHDIVVHPPEARCEVNRFWNEVKTSHQHVEFVKDWNQKWAGIGVLYA